ncbi:MAG: hypothetical protein ACI3Y9_09660 [Candidatus Cryptobacteroides sp.]
MKQKMKILLVAASLLLLGNVCRAQKFQPKDTWPYIFKDFTEGKVYTPDGREILSSELNISVVKGTLNYIEDGTIMAADMMRVSTAVIGDRRFINVMGRMMEVLASSDSGQVIKDVQLDVDEMGKTNIGYGIASSTASSQNVTTLMEGMSDMVNLNISDALTRSKEGTVIPLKEDLYLRYGVATVPAFKKDVLDIRGIDKAEAEAFFKAQKIKWKDPQSLIKVVDFIAENN